MISIQIKHLHKPAVILTLSILTCCDICVAGVAAVVAEGVTAALLATSFCCKLVGATEMFAAVFLMETSDMVELLAVDVT